MQRLEVFKIKLLRVPLCKELDKISKLKIRSGLFYSSKAHEMDESALHKSCHFSHFDLDGAPSVSSMAPTHSLCIPLPGSCGISTQWDCGFVHFLSIAFIQSFGSPSDIPSLNISLLSKG